MLRSTNSTLTDSVTAQIKVSVCMPLYNGERYLREQVSSILAQLRPTDELIAIDDCSFDGSLQLLRGFEDKRIRLVQNAQNVGVIQSVERALRTATGDVLFLADQDDIWLPGKVTRTLEVLQQTGSYAVVSDAILIDNNGQQTSTSHFAVRKSGPGVFRNWWRNGYVGCCMAFDACIKPLILPFPVDIPMHDTWIGTVCDFIQRVEFVPAQLVAYRRHSTNSTELVGSNPIFMLKKRLVWLKIMAQYLPSIRAQAKMLNLLG
jgi:glycosyltransferase involved in cell wall biosynthesis